MIENLYHNLVNDLDKLNLPIEEVDLVLRPYSATLYGRYFPSTKTKPKIYVYPYATELGEYLPYDVILETAIHEMTHHMQYRDSSFKRVRGVMHNSQFWKYYNHYMSRAEKYKMLSRKVVENEFKTIME